MIASDAELLQNLWPSQLKDLCQIYGENYNEAEKRQRSLMSYEKAIARRDKAAMRGQS